MGDAMGIGVKAGSRAAVVVSGDAGRRNVARARTRPVSRRDRCNRRNRGGKGMFLVFGQQYVQQPCSVPRAQGLQQS